MRYVYVTGYLSLAAIIQLLMGNFPLSFVAFPLNIVFAVIWLFLLWKLYKESRKSAFTRFLYSYQPQFRDEELEGKDLQAKVTARYQIAR